jgi:hypothetical protein
MTHTHRDELSDLLALANTRHGPGAHYRIRARIDDPDHDHLENSAEARAFLAGHAVEVPAGDPGPVDLADLRRVREAARAVVDGGPGPTDPVVASLIDRARFRLAADGRLRPASRGWRAVTEAMLPGLVELDRSRDRLRVCANPACRFIFVDRSRNGARRWCEMAVCGNRVKGRRFRHRMAAAAT